MTRNNSSIIFLFSAIIMAVLLAGGIVLGQSIIYHGNTKSHVFHKPGCRYYNCKKCSVEFTTRVEALASGYRPCKVCKP